MSDTVSVRDRNRFRWGDITISDQNNKNDHNWQRFPERELRFAWTIYTMDKIFSPVWNDLWSNFVQNKNLFCQLEDRFGGIFFYCFFKFIITQMQTHLNAHKLNTKTGCLNEKKNKNKLNENMNIFRDFNTVLVFVFKMQTICP